MWYCLYSSCWLCEYHDLGQIPIFLPELGPEEEPIKWGLGRSIDSPHQLAEFHELQMSQVVSKAFVTNQAELA
jgi:hypothetical protein